MHGVDLYRRVRLACHREGLSRREASRQFGIDRKTVAKILLHSEPPGYRRRQPPKRPKLAPFTDIIDGILEEDRTVHRKQRHTAKRIFERLRDEHGFTGKQTIVNDYVRERHLVVCGRCSCRWRTLRVMPRRTLARRMRSLPASCIARIFFVMTLPHSDACFVAACPAAAEAWPPSIASSVNTMPPTHNHSSGKHIPMTSSPHETEGSKRWTGANAFISQPCQIKGASDRDRAVQNRHRDDDQGQTDNGRSRVDDQLQLHPRANPTRRLEASV